MILRIFSKYIFLLLAMLSSTLAWSAEAVDNSAGRTLFLRHCAACHGLDGKGGVGVPLAMSSFQKSVSDAYLASTIHTGRHGRVMPGFDFNETDTRTLIRYLRSMEGGASGPSASKTVVKGDVTRGRMLFAQRCAACHGAEGEGGTGTGVTFSRPRDLPIIAPALNNSDFLAAADDAMIKRTLMEGREGTPMNSFIKQGLKEKDINDLVSYVRSFAASPYDKRQPDHSDQPRLLVATSPYDLEKTVEQVKSAVVAANFKLIRVQYLNQGMVEEGKEDKHQVIVYFCNFNFLNEALAVDPRVGLFLPCRLTIIENNGKVTLSAANPQPLSDYFNNYELQKLCDRLKQLYTQILEEATL